MILVLALTQFAFISLGIMALHVMVSANADPSTIPPHIAQLDSIGIWLFLIPFVWMFLAQCTILLSKKGTAVDVARVSGAVIAAVVFLVYAVAVLVVA